MSDRDLLEKAAKAAGLVVHRGIGWQSDMLFVSLKDQHGIVTGREWNPLTDDGDALRLAVKLKMVIDTDYNGGAAAGNALVGLDDDEPEYGYQEGNGRKDPYAATRRAIVRAAAALGDDK